MNSPSILHFLPRIDHLCHVTPAAPEKKRRLKRTFGREKFTALLIIHKQYHLEQRIKETPKKHTTKWCIHEAEFN